MSVNGGLMWVAEYTDGRRLYQIDPVTGQEVSSDQVDRSVLKRMSVVGSNNPNGCEITALDYEPGDKMLFRRRVEHKASGEVVVGYLLGRVCRGTTTIHLIKPSELGGYYVQSADGFMRDHPWLYPIQPVPADDLVVRPHEL